MSNINLYSSNRTEELIYILSDIIIKEPLEPLTPEIIIIPSAGMERYIAFSLAQKNHICANNLYLFPNAFIHFIYQNIWNDTPSKTVFDPEILCWKLYSILPGFLNKIEFGHISSYINNDPSEVKMFQICKKIADLFDQYTVFRPEMIHKWEVDKKNQNLHEKWQSELWNSIVNNTLSKNRVKLQRELHSELMITKNKETKKSLPQRITLFGISYLPKFHLEFLQILAPFCEVNLFTLNPCRHFWDDIVSKKQFIRETDTSLSNQPENKPTDLHHFETGNTLLASLGEYGKEFFTLVHSYDTVDHESFINPDEKSILSVIQSDILHLHSRDIPCIVEDPHHSLQLHVCHSPIRELEVLYDSILSFFDSDPHLLPQEIAVMTPDIEKYTPYIRTVFEHPSDKRHYIPFTIADMPHPKYNQIISDFLFILDLPQKRFSASSVLSVIESENIRKTLNLNEDDISAIHLWINETNIKWGIDNEYRKSLSLPPTNENTWKSGLERLFLGYAISEDCDSVFNGIAPSGSFNESHTETLEKFYLFLKRLFEIHKNLKKEKTLSQWADYLFEIINCCFAGNETGIHEVSVSSPADVDKIRKTVLILREYETITHCTEKVPFPVVRSYLESSLKTKDYGKGFLCGGVSFCNILPMRTVPFKIICIIGMNDGSFPRTDSSVSFNLISMKRRVGDRSLRKEDRYCFLETILCARKKLYVSYVGFNPRDNTPIPPSIVVSELMEYISNNYRFSHSEDDPGTVLNEIITHHTLNGCNPRYFSLDRKYKDKYFSYSNENAVAISSKKAERKPLFGSLQTFSEDTNSNSITLDQLFSFFSNPIKFFLVHKLGIIIPDKNSLISDTEPFTINRLDKYKLEQKLLENKIIQRDNKALVNTTYSSGLIPHGTPGICTLQEINETVHTFMTNIKKTSITPEKKSFADIDINLSEVNITGRVSFLSKDNLVHFKPAEIKPRDILKIWLSHLLLSLSNNKELPSKSLLIGMKSDRTQQCFKYSEVTDASSILKKLLDLFYCGLSEPIHFFPATSYIYAYEILRGKDNDYAISKAEQEWIGSRFKTGESDNAYYRVYPGKKISINEDYGFDRDHDFIQTALTVFRPIFEHEEKVQL